MNRDTSALENFVLAALLQKKPTKGLNLDSVLNADVKRVLDVARPGEDAKTVVRATLEQLVAAGFVVRPKPSTLELTDEGRQKAHGFLEVKEVPKADWRKLIRAYLVPKVLGVTQEISAKQREKIQKVEGLREELLRLHFDLPLPPVADTKKLKRELGWSLLEQGASRNLIEHARGKKAGFAAEPLLDVLCLHAAGNSMYLPQKGIPTLAAHLVAARNLDSNELVCAVLAQWLRDAPSVAAREGGPSEPQQPSQPQQPSHPPQASSAPQESAAPAPQEPSSPTLPCPDASDAASYEGSDAEPLEQFAARVQRAARSAPTGWFGDRLVFVSHVWRALQAEGETAPLDEFKSRLAEAYRGRHIVLTKADMPQTMDPKDLADSRIIDHDTNLVFVEVGGPTHD